MTRDAEVAADLTHDTFVKVFERVDQFEARGSREGWVFRIAINVVRERHRTNGRHRELLERERSTFDRSTGADDDRVESRIVLDEALSTLPAAQRTALLLYEVDGYTHPEIGEMMGVAEGSSRARVSRAKAAMRAWLEKRI